MYSSRDVMLASGLVISKIPSLYTNSFELGFNATSLESYGIPVAAPIIKPCDASSVSDPSGPTKTAGGWPPPHHLIVLASTSKMPYHSVKNMLLCCAIGYSSFRPSSTAAGSRMSQPGIAPPRMVFMALTPSSAGPTPCPHTSSK